MKPRRQAVAGQAVLQKPRVPLSKDHSSRRRQRPARRRRWLVAARAHWLFLVVLLLGLALRVVVAAAYRPALWFHSDTFSYLAGGVDLSTHPVRPMGYALLLRALEPLPHSLALLTALQHLLGLAIGVLLYALLVRLAVPRMIATVAASPVLLDGYQLQLEHLVMSDVLYAFLTTAGVVALVWSERPSWRVAAAAGLLLGAAAVTRSVGLPVAAAVLAVLVLRRGGLRVVGAAALACALPVAAYAVWFQAEQGKWALTNSNGIFLYSRVMAFADCSLLTLTPPERALCDPRPPQDRPESSRYLWTRGLPLQRLPGATFTPQNDALGRSFALKAVRAQPLDYARQVTRELGYTFTFKRVPVPVVDLAKYEFVSDPSRLVPKYAQQSGLRQVRAYDGEHIRSLNTAAEPRLTAFLDRYQDLARVPGPVVGVLVLLALAAVLPTGPRTVRGPTLTLAAAAATLLLVPPMTAQFDPRYVLAAVPLLAAAAALSGSGLRRVPSPELS